MLILGHVLDACYVQTVLALDAITKHHKLDGLNNRHLFLTVLEAGKSKIQVLAYLVPGDNLLPGL